jgi:AcrR family transcriptional regulator
VAKQVAFRDIIVYNGLNQFSSQGRMVMDKRIIKTRNAIKNAFMTLMLEKELNKISVSDVTEKALINRSTFYLHYSDVGSVMEDIEREIADKIAECIEAYDMDNPYESTYALFSKLTETLSEMDIMKKYILYSTNSKYIIQRLKDIFAEKTLAALKENERVHYTEEIIYPITFATSGMIDTYIKWAYADNKIISLERLSQLGSEIYSTLQDYWSLKY